MLLDMGGLFCDFDATFPVIADRNAIRTHIHTTNWCTYCTGTTGKTLLLRGIFALR